MEQLVDTELVDMSDYIKGKTYEKDGIYHNVSIQNSENSFSINFSPIDKKNESLGELINDSSKSKKKNPWWKF